MSVSEEIIKKISEEFEFKHKKLMEEAIQQAIICGEVTIKVSENNVLEIINPFKGCGCGD